MPKYSGGFGGLVHHAAGLVMMGSLALATPGALGQYDGHGSQSEKHGEDHGEEGGHGSSSRFPDVPMPLQIEGFPQRPKPLLELGPPFLGTGPLDRGIEMPGGSVWQPALLIHGNYRTAIQTFDNGFTESTDWANRLDLFANLQLTSTERLVVGTRPLDQDNEFSGYVFEPGGRADGWEDGLNGRLTTLFFEGDIGEIFADWDPMDQKELDWGFSVGRQPLVFQEGLLLNDTVDGIAIVRDTLFPAGGSDLKLTFFYGWDNIHRNDNDEEGGTDMFALFTESDFPRSTYQVDIVYVSADERDGGDGIYWGVGAIQRIGQVNTAFRIVGSQALDRENAKVSSGHLLFGEVSWTPHYTHDNVYINAFWGIDQFASAARAPDAGGPLGRTGILFAAVGLGRYGAALGNRANDAVGGSVGYQWFSKDSRRQLIVEAGARTSTDSVAPGVMAIGGRYQQAFGQNTVLRFDAFAAFPDAGDSGYGGRVELQFKF